MMLRSRTVPVFGLFWMATTFGCRDVSESSGGPGDEADARTVVTDSGGVRSARITDLDSRELPEFGLTLLYSTLGHLDLVQVVGAVLLPDSTLAVADRVAPNLTFLGPNGELRSQVGSEGEGPGDYSDIARIGVTTDQSLFVYDRALRRLTFLDWTGNVVDVQRTGCMGEVVPLAQVNGEGFVGVLEARPDLPPGVQRGPLTLIACTGNDGSFDSLGEWPGKERYVTSNRQNWVPVGFGRTALYDGRGVHSVVGTNDSLDLTRYRELAVHTHIRGGVLPTSAVTPEEREEWTDLFLSGIPEIARATWRSRLEQSEVRDTYPAVGAVKVDAGGRIWIGEYAKLSGEWRRWWVIGPDGTPVGSVRLPVYHPDWLTFSNGTFTGRAMVESEVTIPSPSHEVLDITADRIAVLRKDDLGTEFVEVYAISMP